MVVPLLALLGAAALGAPPPAGILLSSPRSAIAGGLLIEYQTNVEDGSMVHGPGMAAGLGAGIVLGVEGMIRSREGSPGVTDRFALREFEFGWWAWEAGAGPPVDLGVAVAWTDSSYERTREGQLVLRSGERTLGVALRASRAIGWFEPGLGLQWSSRFFKIRRIRLDYLAPGASLHVRPGSLPVGVFGEWTPWLANPDRLPVAWSAGVALGPARQPTLVLFVTNTYGSAMPTVLSAIPDVLWGARVSVGWKFLRPAD